MTSVFHFTRWWACWLLFCGTVAAFEVKHGNAIVRVDGVEDAQWKALEGMLKDQLTLNGGGPLSEPLADDLASKPAVRDVEKEWVAAARQAWREQDVRGCYMALAALRTYGTVRPAMASAADDLQAALEAMDGAADAVPDGG